MIEVTMFADRTVAGQQLAALLENYRADGYLLALPRGGVPVAVAVAERLQLPIEVLVVRKLGAPRNPEYALGAIAEGGVKVIDELAVRWTHTSHEELAAIIAAEASELERRRQRYRQGRPLPDLTNRTAIIIDDGIATGASIAAAVQAVKKLGRPQRIVIAVPVCDEQVAGQLQPQVDELITVLKPRTLHAIGEYYQHFPQLTDDEVRGWLFTFGHDHVR